MDVKELPGAWVLETYRRGGVDLEVLAQQLPDDVELMLFEMDTILPDPINRLLQACADISGNQNFGLIMNELVDLSMYGLFGYLLLNCGTVADLFETLVRYHTVHHNGGITYEMETDKDTVSVQFCHDERTHADHRHTTEWGLGFIPDFLKTTLGDLSVPLTTQFINAPPENLDQLHDYFGPNLEFNQPVDQIVYPRAILKERILDSNQNLLNVLRKLANKHLLDLQRDSSLRNSIRAILFENLAGSKKSSASDVAGALGMSLSTFKRKLSAERINFKTTKAVIQNEMAQKLLSRTDVKLYEIAHKLGFANQSSFTRFFIRQNHQTPQDYRLLKRSKKTNN